MIKHCLAGITAASLLYASDGDFNTHHLSVDVLTRKALERELKRTPLLDPSRKLIIEISGAGDLVCAIPMKEIHAPPGRRLDPISVPGNHRSGNSRVDAIGHPPPIAACPQH